MADPHRDVKPTAALQPTAAATGVTSPGAYTEWRTTTLGRVTEALEQRRILELVGSVDGKRVLDVGCGDGLLTTTLATRGARAVGVDIDRSMLRAAVARTDPGQRQPARFVEGRLEQLPFRDAMFDVVVAVTVLCLLGSRRRCTNRWTHARLTSYFAATDSASSPASHARNTGFRRSIEYGAIAPPKREVPHRPYCVQSETALMNAGTRHHRRVRPRQPPKRRTP